LAWRAHVLARFGIIALVGLQITWGGDVPFIPSHSMLRTSLPSAVSDFLASGYRGNREERLAPFGNYSKIGRALPSEAVTQDHENLQSLGIRSQRISDAPGTQGGISYGGLERSSDVHQLLQGLGVTHVVADRKKAPGHASLASDFMFHDWVRHTTSPRAFGALTLSEMPARTPEDTLSHDALVAVLGCKQQSYAPGVYELRQLNRSPHEAGATFPAPKRALGTQLVDYVASEDVRLAVTLEGCATPKKLRAQSFRELVRRKHETLWVR
jgi:hypothetical protein